MIKKLNLVIWDREFSLPIEYDCYKGERITKKQIVALDNFLSHSEWMAEAKKAVEEFCHDAVMDDEDNEKKDNIFSYVKPDYLFVKRDNRVAVMCNYRYDPEHGLAIVFSADGNTTVGIQDVIL